MGSAPQTILIPKGGIFLTNQDNSIVLRQTCDGNLSSQFPLSENNKKSQEIITLTNELCALEQRNTLQERYSSKDCLIFENRPWAGKEFLPTFITHFLSEYMNFLTNPERFKACHFLERGQKNTPPAIIVKIVYFHEKNEIYSRKKMLWGVINKMNGRLMFIKEKFSTKNTSLQVYANDRNLVTRTQNCQVQLLIENIRIRKSIDVNSPKTIDDNIAIAVPKEKSRLPMGTKKVIDTKQCHTVQLATQNKAVREEISDHELENDSPESKRPNLRPSPQNCSKVNAISRKKNLTLQHSHS